MTTKTRTLNPNGTNSILTIVVRGETYDVNAACEFIPNFARHILAGDVVTVRDESGQIVGSNPGKATKLTGWNIRHDDIDPLAIAKVLLERTSENWKF